MNAPRKGPGRPRLPDSKPQSGSPVLARPRASNLDPRDLEARRYVDRMRKRRYREARRSNRGNPQALPTGVDGLEHIKTQAIIANLQDAVARRDREIAKLRDQLREARR